MVFPTNFRRRKKKELCIVGFEIYGALYETNLLDHPGLVLNRFTENSSEGVVLVFYFLSGPQWTDTQDILVSSINFMDFHQMLEIVQVPPYMRPSWFPKQKFGDDSDKMVFHTDPDEGLSLRFPNRMFGWHSNRNEDRMIRVVRTETRVYHCFEMENLKGCTSRFERIHFRIWKDLLSDNRYRKECVLKLRGGTTLERSPIVNITVFMTFP